MVRTRISGPQPELAILLPVNQGILFNLFGRFGWF